MEILVVWCVELNEVVDIYDAQNAYSDLPENNRQRFTFRCSDEECRRVRNPLVSGVNYHRLAEETENCRQPHFRAPAANEQLPTCIWYQPAGAAVSTAGEAKKDAARRKNVGYSTTPKLERFIDCWLQFQGAELKVHEVAIEGNTLSYRSAVTNPVWIKQEHNGRRILYGAASLTLWPAEKPAHLYLNFHDNCEQFDENLGSKSLTIQLPLARVRQHRGGNVLLSKLSPVAHNPGGGEESRAQRVRHAKLAILDPGFNFGQFLVGRATRFRNRRLALSDLKQGRAVALDHPTFYFILH